MFRVWGGAGASERNRTLEITVQRDCCFVQKSVMGPKPMLRGKNCRAGVGRGKQ